MEANHNLISANKNSGNPNPVAGYIALTLDACSIIISGLVFCPLALAACLISLFKQEFFLGSTALILKVIGFSRRSIF